MGGASRIRLLISDVDGTLVTGDKRLTPATIESVHRLRDAGIQFAVVSSRPPRGMAMLVEPLRITTYLAGFNGGAIVTPDQSQVDTRSVSPAAVDTTLAAFARAGVDTWVFADGKWLVTNPEGAYVARERRAVQFDPTVVPDFRPYILDVGKLVGSTQDFDLLANVEAELHTELRGSAAANRSQRYYLDVTHPDANKGAAALSLARLLGVPIEETACIGDMANDIPMLRLAGLSIAMGNAPPEVQAVAHEVTAANDADGLAAAVERLILPRAAA
jgi:Cof subfamily protein (haloacid dehalogenase superfamily)